MVGDGRYRGKRSRSVVVITHRSCPCVQARDRARRETSRGAPRRSAAFSRKRFVHAFSRRARCRAVVRPTRFFFLTGDSRRGVDARRGAGGTRRGLGAARTTRARTSAVANAGSPRPDWYAAPVASAVTSELCDDGNPPLPTMRPALNLPVTVQSLNGLRTCATTTAIIAATSPTLSPMVVASEPTEDAIFAKDREGAVRADE